MKNKRTTITVETVKTTVMRRIHLNQIVQEHNFAEEGYFPGRNESRVSFEASESDDGSRAKRDIHEHFRK